MGPERVDNLTLGQAVDEYIASRTKDGGALRQTLARFVRWFGPERQLTQIRPADLEDFSREASAGAQSGAERIKAVRDFLTFATKSGMVDSRLAQHVKTHRQPRQSRAKTARVGEPSHQVVHLTQEGYDSLVAEREHLADELARNAREIQRAAADKDVRENAPLEAAREHQGQLTARMLVVEDTLSKAAVVGRDGGDGQQVRHGSTLRLEDLGTGTVVEWTIVDPREANSLARKISTDSPVGEAVLGKRLGDEVEVKAPAGVRRYRLVHVE